MRTAADAAGAAPPSLSLGSQRSWVTSQGSQCAEAELCPHPSAAGYPGVSAAASAHVTIADQVLYLSDAAGKVDKATRRLATTGRRGRKVKELEQGLEVVKVAVKRKVHTHDTTADGGHPEGARRLELSVHSAQHLSKSACIQLSHAVRESVGPLRPLLHVDIEVPVAEKKQ